MAKKRGVSGKTHTQKQLDDYANQHNPNNSAYRATEMNKVATDSNKIKNQKIDYSIWNVESYDWYDD